MLFLGSDLAPTVVNLGRFALAIAAAERRISSRRPHHPPRRGARARHGGHGCNPLGGAYNDVVGLALILVAIAIVLHRRDEPMAAGQAAAAALALGLWSAPSSPSSCRRRRSVSAWPSSLSPVAAHAGRCSSCCARRCRAATGTCATSSSRATHFHLSLAVGLHLPTAEGASRDGDRGQFSFDGKAWTENSRRASGAPSVRSGWSWSVWPSLARWRRSSRGTKAVTRVPDRGRR